MRKDMAGQRTNHRPPRTFGGAERMEAENCAHTSIT